MELVFVEDSRYAEYESLLLDRDRYHKEAYQALGEYTRIFGEKITEVFKQRIACIERKKMLSYCLMYFNRGERVDLKKVQEQIKKEMEEYQAQLSAMIENNEACKKSRVIPQKEALRIKQIYRSIAKKLHPDLNPLTEQHEELMELWRRNITAYQCNNLKELEEIEVLVEQALAALGQGKATISIPDIDEKIEKLYKEIEKIRNTDPYLFRELLDDPSLVEEKNIELDKELKDYQEYAAKLDAELKRFIVEGGTFTWEMEQN
jgi:hypothetical protein